MTVQTPAEEGLITADELAVMVGIERCELVDGRIVPVARTNDEHAGIELNVGSALRSYVISRREGHARVGEAGIKTRTNPDRVRGADALYISNDRYEKRTKGSAYLDVPPEIVVEVLSPGDAAVDLHEKLREYFAMGVNLAWIIDSRARIVSVYRSMSDITELSEKDTLTAPGILLGWSVSVASLFEI